MDEVLLNEDAIEAADAPAESETTPQVLGDEDIWGFDTTTEESVEASNESDGEAEETNQSDGEAVEQEANDSEETEADEDTPDFLTVTFNHEDRKLSRKEAQTNSQKGMNYDKVKNQLDDANAKLEQAKRYENFLNEIKGDFSSIDELMIDTRARMLVDAEAKKGNTITLENAKATVKERMPAPIDAKRLQADNAVKAFQQVYGDVKADSIPQEVWDDVKITGDLLGAYHNYEKRSYEQEIERLKKDLESEKQKNKNASRKVGGSKSSGRSESAKSYLDKIWDGL